MKKFVRRHVIQKSVRGCEDGRGVGMFHPASTSARRVADVIDERVLAVGSAVHESQLVVADFAESVFDLALVPVIAMDDDMNGRSKVGYSELLEMRSFDRGVREGVIAGRLQ